MRASRLGMLLLGMTAVWCLAGGPSQGGGATDEVKLKVVKYDEFGDIIRANKGKVIILDFWYFTCIACKEAFPNLVDMHKKYAAKDLVVISVNTDELDDAGKPPKNVVKFLNEQKATMLNVLLDADAEVKKDKLRLRSYPCVYVFNRDGQWTQFMGEDGLKRDEKHRYYQVEEYIKQLLDQPAKTAIK
jgi:thiol-disulfide isomerase/thioredoxin